jgi:Kef-type K+ transport system membrane component KefB
MIEFNNLLILLLLIWLAGKLFRHLKFPVLFGELLVGILAGPKILGIVEQTEMISLMAEFGIFFLMLHEGLTNDPRELFRASKRSFSIGIFATLFPLAVGVAVGLLLGYDLIQSGIVGCFFGITAVTVSTRIFKDCNYEVPKINNIVFSSALISDILAIILISMLFEINESGFEIRALLVKLFLAVAFFGLTLGLGQKFFKYISQFIYKGNKAFTFTLILAVAFALLAETMGLKPMIGAFLAGLFIREEVISTELYDKIEDRIYGLSYSFLGPIFFVSIAFNINLNVFWQFPVVLLIFVMASFSSKYLATYMCSLYSGLTVRESSIVSLAMNSRGALEIILLSLAVTEGLISQDVFSILILSSFLVTFISILFLRPLVKRSCV